MFFFSWSHILTSILRFFWFDRSSNANWKWAKAAHRPPAEAEGEAHARVCARWKKVEVSLLPNASSPVSQPCSYTLIVNEGAGRLVADLTATFPAAPGRGTTVHLWKWLCPLSSTKAPKSSFQLEHVEVKRWEETWGWGKLPAGEVSHSEINTHTQCFSFYGHSLILDGCFWVHI